MTTMVEHTNARTGINRGRENWKAFYDVIDGRAVGEIWKPSNEKLRSFNVKLGDDGTFKVDITESLAGTAAKVYFKH